MTTLSINHIEQTPELKGGVPHIAGRRIPVHRIVIQHAFYNEDAPAIAEAYNLTLGQVHAALSYYYDHMEEINTIIAEEDESYAAAVEQQSFTESTGGEYITAAQARSLLGLSEESRYISRLCREGRLECKKIANRWMVTRSSVEAYNRANPGRGRPSKEQIA